MHGSSVFGRKQQLLSFLVNNILEKMQRLDKTFSNRFINLSMDKLSPKVEIEGPRMQIQPGPKKSRIFSISIVSKLVHIFLKQLKATKQQISQRKLKQSSSSNVVIIHIIKIEIFESNVCIWVSTITIGKHFIHFCAFSVSRFELTRRSAQCLHSPQESEPLIALLLSQL